MAQAILIAPGTLRLGNGSEYPVSKDIRSFSSTESEYIAVLEATGGWVRIAGAASDSLQPEKSWRLTVKTVSTASYDSRENVLRFPNGSVQLKRPIAEVLQARHFEAIFIVVFRGNDDMHNVAGLDNSGKELWRVGDPPAPFKSRVPYGTAYDAPDGMVNVTKGAFTVVWIYNRATNLRSEVSRLSSSLGGVDPKELRIRRSALMFGVRTCCVTEICVIL
jgi:hypothetical protein